jgi:hypothetical protein
MKSSDTGGSARRESMTMPPRRKNYYGSPPRTLAPLQAPQVDRVAGGKAIGAVLGLKDKQVYRLIEATMNSPDPIPVKHVPTLGLCADKATLLRWWARRLGADVA